MASAAFPFIFHNVTLRNYTPDIGFGFDDLRDPGGLALKIWDSQDGVSRLIRAHLDPTTRGMLAEYRGAGVPSRELTYRILTELDKVPSIPRTRGDELLDEKTLSGIALRDETRRLLAEKPEGRRRDHLVRLIIEDAYPGEIRREGPKYVHLFDGGPADNLGVESLLRAAREFYFHVPEGRNPEGCFIFIIDAYQGASNPAITRKPDTRGFIEYIFSKNVIDASDALLSVQRENIVEKGQREGSQSKILKWEFYDLRSKTDVTCKGWHITFESLAGAWFRSGLARSDIRDRRQVLNAYARISYIVAHIETHFKLTSSLHCSAKFLQARLYDAAKLLVNDDMHSLSEVREWFQSNGLALLEPPQPEAAWAPELPVIVGAKQRYCDGVE